jgi:hypothetical protein
MKNNKSFLFAALFIISTVAGLSKAAISKDTKGAILEGEVVDVSCFVGLEQKEHHQGRCTKSCLLDGTPIGLATPAGTLYLLLENSTDKKPYQLAKQTPSQKVRIVGRTLTRGGFHTLTVDRLEIVGQEAAGCSERAPDPALGAPGYCGEN